MTIEMSTQRDEQERKTLLFILETYTVINVIKSMQRIIKDRQTCLLICKDKELHRTGTHRRKSMDIER